MEIRTSWARRECLYLDINSGGTVPVDLDVEVIPQFKTGHKGSWALRASDKRCCSSIKSWTSFLRRLFSCSRHSYAWSEKMLACQKPHQSYAWTCIWYILQRRTTITNICLHVANKDDYINIFYIQHNVQIANLMQFISSLGLSFAAPLCSNSVLFSSFQPFFFIIRALKHNHKLWLLWCIVSWTFSMQE